jgi:hypothetical protein
MSKDNHDLRIKYRNTKVQANDVQIVMEFAQTRQAHIW